MSEPRRSANFDRGKCTRCGEECFHICYVGTPGRLVCQPCFAAVVLPDPHAHTGEEKP